MDFWGGPLWDGTALVDILPFENVSGKRRENVKSHFPVPRNNPVVVLLENLRG